MIEYEKPSVRRHKRNSPKGETVISVKSHGSQEDMMQIPDSKVGNTDSIPYRLFDPTE